jgi:hypothetical protein
VCDKAVSSEQFHVSEGCDMAQAAKSHASQICDGHNVTETNVSFPHQVFHQRSVFIAIVLLFFLSEVQTQEALEPLLDTKLLSFSRC